MAKKRTYMVVYTDPAAAVGAYKVKADDSLKASEIVSNELKKTLGDFKDSRSIVVEIPNGKINVIHA